MNFDESTSYLLSLGNEVSAMKLGLENIRTLLAALGNPQNNYLKVQVAGTNGKGSVCAFLNSICLAAGINTGMYTSPHLNSITERIRIGGKEISEDDFARFATRVRERSEGLAAAGEIDGIPTFFEQVTAIALLAFAEARVALAILETGLGGRLDATTAANAEIAAITRIDLDHQKYLGETIGEIAAEKAAIVHSGSRVVIGDQQKAAMNVIVKRCADVGVQPHFASHLTEGGNPSGSEGVSCGEQTPSPRVGFPRLGLGGRHQVENASIAIHIVDVLREHFPISEQNVRDGLQSASHPGRLEFSGRFLFDGAHNIGGARALREYLDEFVNQPITIIFGAMEDKDVSEIASILFPKANKLILTQPENPRALSAAQLRGSVPDDLDPANVFTTDNSSEAIEKANGVSGEGDLILVTGSLYLVAEARAIVSADFPEKLITEN
ncbi:MAG TPA: folylpolyglutamate synthase/dihydrofolate synthase family protein [Pyrinomonadaceae bacterium]|nr:folylpolyglutamate synthase/dihydrofolate synthase family protein [Pyrinomonadaceae bacterium]